jgi:Rrf2 family transcriptional regulator, iron-sulfur cluster assembly transcription factor
MKLTSHEEYGLRCLLRLGQEGPGGSLTIPEISEAEGISEAYAGKLLRMLRRGGLVKAARGNVGGYSLARPAGQIVLSDAMNVLGQPLFEGDFCNAHSGQMQTCVRSVDCSLRVLWRDIQTAIDRVLQRTTLEDLFRHEKQMVAWVQGLKDIVAASNTRQ